MRFIRPVIWISGLLFILLITRIFFFEIVSVNDFRMSSTLLPNDRLITTKWRKPLHRNSIISYHDPTFFDLPTRKKPVVTSRLLGMPGDTLQIIDKNVLVNASPIDPPVQARWLFRVVTDGSPISSDFIVQHHLQPPMEIADIGIWDVYLDSAAFEQIQKAAYVNQIRAKKMFTGDPSSGFWPYSSFYNWNRDQMGPVIIPHEGLTVDISIRTIEQYRDIIENYENNEVLIDYTEVRINGRIVDTYTFQNNYFFVLDDHRDHPSDSRIFGYLPEDHIIGKSRRILWSPSRKSFLKSVD